jgi:predicted MFS family arabinose efflux permease
MAPRNIRWEEWRLNWTLVLAGAFDRERSLAIAFTLGGVSLCQILAPPLAQGLIADFGWRVAFIALGTLITAALIARLGRYPVLDRSQSGTSAA